MGTELNDLFGLQKSIIRETILQLRKINTSHKNKLIQVITEPGDLCLKLVQPDRDVAEPGARIPDHHITEPSV